MIVLLKWKKIYSKSNFKQSTWNFFMIKKSPFHSLPQTSVRVVRVWLGTTHFFFLYPFHLFSVSPNSSRLFLSILLFLLRCSTRTAACICAHTANLGNLWAFSQLQRVYRFENFFYFFLFPCTRLILNRSKRQRRMKIFFDRSKGESSVRQIYFTILRIDRMNEQKNYFPFKKLIKLENNEKNGHNFWRRRRWVAWIDLSQTWGVGINVWSDNGQIVRLFNSSFIFDSDFNFKNGMSFVDFNVSSK